MYTHRTLRLYFIHSKGHSLYEDLSSAEDFRTSRASLHRSVWDRADAAGRRGEGEKTGIMFSLSCE